MIKRIITTILTFVLWGVVQVWLSTQATVMAGEVAGKQFENSNAVTVTTQTQLAVISNFHLPVILLVIIIAIIWQKPIRKLFCKPKKMPDGGTI